MRVYFLGLPVGAEYRWWTSTVERTAHNEKLLVPVGPEERRGVALVA